MGKTSKAIYEFGEFRLDVANYLLLRGGEMVPLKPKVFETLLVLIEGRGRVLSKEELMQRLWPEMVVDEANLTQNIYLLRKVFGGDAHGLKYIETIPKRGYRFVAEIREGETLIVEEIRTARVVVAEEIEEEETSAADGQENWFEAIYLPNTRPDTTSAQRCDMSRRLKALLLVPSVLGLFALFLYFNLIRVNESGKADPPIKSLAVLPFKSLGAVQSDESLGLGMTEALITRLSRLNQVVVRPMSAVRGYATSSLDSILVGKKLKVDAVLEGSIQKADDGVRVTARLLRVVDGKPLRTYNYDEHLTDIFAVQDTVSALITQALTQMLTGGEQGPSNRRETDNPEAHQLYLKGRWYWDKRTAKGYEKAIEHFDQAISLDPRYALAYSGLADTYILLGGCDFAAPNGVMLKARAAAEKAFMLDATLAEAHTSLALIAQNYERDWVGAEKEYQKALELDPNYAAAQAWYGEFLAWLSRPNEGSARMEQALKLDPLSLPFNKDAGVILYLSRQYDRAIKQLRKTLELDQNFVEAHRVLAEVYLQRELYDDALAANRKAYELEGDSKSLAGVGQVFAAMGKRGEAQRVLSQLQEKAKRQHVQPLRIAIIYAALGEKDQAFAWLEKEYEERGAGLIGLKTDPVWDSLRSDPRFAKLLRHLRL